MFTARQVRGWRSHRHSRPGTEKSSRIDTPDASWTKAQITAWLDRELIDYPSGLSKADLLAIATGPLPPVDL